MIVMFRGKFYKSKNSVYEAFGVDASRVINRQKQGYSFQEAVEIQLANKQHPIPYRGKEYPSQKALALDYEVNANFLSRLLQEGKTVEQAMAFLIDRKMKVFGREFKNYKEVSAFFGVDLITLETTMHRMKDLEESIKEILDSSPLIFRGAKYNSLTSLCAAYRIPLSTVQKRISLGWTMEDALEKPIDKSYNKTNNIYEHNGGIYTSLNDLALANGLTVPGLRFTREGTDLTVNQTIDLINSHLAKYKGNRPEVVSKIPSVIYKDDWIPTLQEFCLQVNTTRSILKYVLREKGFATHHEALTYIATAEVEKLYDNVTKQFFTHQEALNVLRISVRDGLKSGRLEKKVTRAYPYCTFDPQAYFAMPGRDFKKVVEQYKKHK